MRWLLVGVLIGLSSGVLGLGVRVYQLQEDVDDTARIVTQMDSSLTDAFARVKATFEDVPRYGSDIDELHQRVDELEREVALVERELEDFKFCIRFRDPSSCF